MPGRVGQLRPQPPGRALRSTQVASKREFAGLQQTAYPPSESDRLRALRERNAIRRSNYVPIRALGVPIVRNGGAQTPAENLDINVEPNIAAINLRQIAGHCG